MPENKTMETFIECPVCNSKEIDLYSHCTDLSISKEQFSITKCRNCSFLFTNPRPSLQEIGKYYQSEEYISHSNSTKGLINSLYHLVRTYTLNKKLNLINSFFPKKGNLLDIGCGTGYFLTKCKKDGWQIKGTEPEEQARTHAEKATQTSIYSNIEKIGGEKPFEVITMWHVLEHVHNLNEAFEKIVSLLKEKGKLIIAVPNPTSYDAKHYKMTWAAWDIPRHLYHFTPDTINKFLLKHKIKLVETKPMYFDSFYVSLLSEKYKGSNALTGLCKGLLNGLLSNIKGRGKSTSSLIYICEKQ